MPSICYVSVCVLRHVLLICLCIPGKPITVSCAYSGRIAIAYRYGAIRTTSEHPEDKFVNLCVAIYECESTGELTNSLLHVYLTS